MHDDDTGEHAPAGPAEALLLIESERAAAQRGMEPDPRLTYMPWGVAWFVGLGLLFLRYGPDDRVLVPMPAALPLVVLYILLVAAAVISTRAGMKAGRQVHGVSSTQGLRYSLSWVAAFAVVTVVGIRYSGSLPPGEVVLLWAGLSTGVVGTLYITGAAIWQSRDMFTLGVLITVANVGGFLAGPGWHSLVISVAGGGGLLLVGLVNWLRWRRPAR